MVAMRQRPTQAQLMRQPTRLFLTRLFLTRLPLMAAMPP
jgi:hypothetical protein